MSGLELGNNDPPEKQQTLQVLVAGLSARCFPIEPSYHRTTGEYAWSWSMYLCRVASTQRDRCHAVLLTR